MFSSNIADALSEMLPNARNMFSQILSELENSYYLHLFFMKVVVDHSKPLLNTLWLRDLDVSEYDGFESSLNIARISISAPNLKLCRCCHLHYFSDTSWPLESHPEIFNLLQNNFDIFEHDVMWLPTNWCARAWIYIRYKCLWNMHDLKIYENLMETILMIN